MPRAKQFLLYLFLIPFCSFAQDSTVVKKQANRFAKASFNGDYKTVLDLTYPKLIAYSGGRDTMQKLVTNRINSLKEQGVIAFDGYVDTPGKFHNSGGQIHCLIPEIVIMKMFNGRYVNRTYLLGISDDKGKSWTFMDVGKMPSEVLQRLVPNYNPDLVIPTAGKPMFFTDKL